MSRKSKKEIQTEEVTEEVAAEVDADLADELADDTTDAYEMAGEDVEGTELEDFDSVEVEDVEELNDHALCSVVESLLFSTDKPMSVKVMKAAFQGTQIKSADIRRAIEQLRLEYDSPNRGVFIEEVSGGFQLRTKPDNMKYLRQTVKTRPFKLSGPALEVLAIMAYKQPCPKITVDEIRGVESGHLMRGLLDRGILRFAGKSELPGRPMLYETSKKFLEIFGLRNLQELPSLNEIDQILPEGIDETMEEKETLSDLTGRLSEEVGTTFSEAEEELGKITDELQAINTSSEFFEQEKQRQKDKRDADKAQDLREKMLVGEEVSTRDRNWLERYELSLLAGTETIAATEAVEVATVEVTAEADIQQLEVADEEHIIEDEEYSSVGSAIASAAAAFGSLDDGPIAEIDDSVDFVEETELDLSEDDIEDSEPTV